MNSNKQDIVDPQDIVSDYRQDCSFSEDDSREEEIEMRGMEEQNIFRDLPDTGFTPIERSNNSLFRRIPLSPAWSQESMEDREDVKPTTAVDAVASSPVFLDGTLPGSVNKISDFDMGSGMIQVLKS